MIVMNDNDDPSDVLATALREMDDIIRYGDEHKFGGVLKAPVSIANGHVNPQNESAEVQSRPLPRTSQGRPRSSDRALFLLEELRMAMSEVSDVREVFREAGIENRRFLQQLACRSNLASPSSASPMSFTQGILPFASLQANGVASDQSTLVSESTCSSSMSSGQDSTVGMSASSGLRRDEVDVLMKQVDDQAVRIADLERQLCQYAMMPVSQEGLLAVNAKQKLRIETLEWENRTLEQSVSDQRRIMADLRLQLFKLDKSHGETQEKLFVLQQQLQFASQAAAAVVAAHADVGSSRSPQTRAHLMLNSPATHSPQAIVDAGFEPGAASTPLPLVMTESMYCPSTPPSAILPSGVVLRRQFDDAGSGGLAASNPHSQLSASLSELHSHRASLEINSATQPAQPYHPHYMQPHPLLFDFETPPSRSRELLLLQRQNPRYASLGRVHPQAAQQHAFIRPTRSDLATMRNSAQMVNNTNGAPSTVAATSASATSNFGMPASPLPHNGQTRKSSFKRFFTISSNLSASQDGLHTLWKKGSKCNGVGGGQEQGSGFCQSTLNRGAPARATVSGRFGSMPLSCTNLPMFNSVSSLPSAIGNGPSFKELDGPQLCAWIHSIGLGMYVTPLAAKKLNGRGLLLMSAKQMEKELCIRHPLHVKKLYLAVNEYRDKEKSACRYPTFFDTAQWLDDVGLPQYKDVFALAGVDPRMLDYMTLEDLSVLKVSNELHCVALRRGIEVLRAVHWDLSLLRRRARRPGSEPRPVSTMTDDGFLINLAGLCSAPPTNDLPKCSTADAVLWTNQKLCEWLRSIDLAEYSVNLRGSGVHGALMILEPRFSCDLFAQLLNIPSSKSLLRRHLYTHFLAVVGSTAQAEKRAVEEKGRTLTISGKLKSSQIGVAGGGSFGGQKLHRGLPAIFGGGGAGLHSNNLQPSDAQLLCPRLTKDDKLLSLIASDPDVAARMRSLPVSLDADIPSTDV